MLVHVSTRCRSVAGLRAVRTFSKRQATILVVTHAAALAALPFASRGAAMAFLVSYLITGYGVSLGYHRALAHGAFTARAPVRALMMTAGVLAFQGGPISWVGFHRAHHRFLDTEGDPHAATCGFFWSHVGWALHKAPNGYRPQKLRRLTASLARDRFLVLLEREHLAINLTAFALAWTVLGAGPALWAFPLRIVVLWHVTWLTNSLAHRAHEGVAGARNIGWLALVGFGEGLHANHHAIPSSPSFARTAREIDPGYWVLCVLAALGLVRMTARRARSGNGTESLSLSGPRVGSAHGKWRRMFPFGLVIPRASCEPSNPCSAWVGGLVLARDSAARVGAQQRTPNDRRSFTG